jgi:branched-subunit amino acid ABC-type transport system permease component
MRELPTTRHGAIVRPEAGSACTADRAAIRDAGFANEAASFEGGWRPRHAKACAFALGMSVAGVAGTLVNPIGGYIAYHIGYTMALVSCT